MNIDLLIRKLSDNSTYYVVSNILGFNMGVNKYLIENKDVDFYRFRNYAGNDTSIHEDFDRTRNGKFANNSILFNNNSSIIKNIKKVSMFDNLKVSQTIEKDEYIYYCEPNLDNLNEFYDKLQQGGDGVILMNKSRLHQFLFPVYVDNAQNDTATNFNMLREFDIEINFGRNKIKTLEDFKIGYSFEYTYGVPTYVFGQSQLYNPNKGFDFFKRETLGSGVKIRRNVNIAGEKYTDWSRCRNSRGNRAYKYKVIALKYTDGYQDKTDIKAFGKCNSYRMHTDMIYGHGAESIHPYYGDDDFTANNLISKEFIFGANYSYNSIMPTCPTVYVDYIDKDSGIDVDTSKIDVSYTDNLKLVGFIRLRMYSWLDIELNSGVLQKYYGDNKIPLRQWVNGQLLTEDYVGRYNAVSELTNTEGFTVKFSIDKRTPHYKYVRNEINGKSVYMLPTSVFENIINENKDISTVYGTDKLKGLLYSYIDFDKFIAYGTSSGWGRGLQLDRNKPNEAKEGIESLGGWLFPPLHMADFTGTWNYQGKLAYSYLSGKTDPKGMDSHFNRISESKYNTFTYANHITQLMHNKLEGWW